MAVNQLETSAQECNMHYFLMLNPADTTLYIRLHHATSKAIIDSSAVSFLLMSCTADTVEIKLLLLYTHTLQHT